GAGGARRLRGDSSPRGRSGDAPERARANSCRLLGRRWRASLSCAYPYLLAAVRADRPLGPVDHDTDRLSLPLIDDANVDTRPKPLRVQVLEEAGLVLELIGDALEDGRGS